MEIERVGTCVECEKVVYCHGGFLEGVLQEGNELFCLTCYKKKKS